MAISNSMSYCREDGKDRIIFMTKEDYEQPPKVFIPDEDDDPYYEEPGLILPNGDINWNCPCLGGIASGPCSVEFKEAFSCFHYSEAEPKGGDCFESFKVMSECMSKYPTLYPEKDDPMDISDEDPDRMGHSAAPERGDVTANEDESAVEESNPTESVSITENADREEKESKSGDS